VIARCVELTVILIVIMSGFNGSMHTADASEDRFRPVNLRLSYQVSLYGVNDDNDGLGWVGILGDTTVVYSRPESLSTKGRERERFKWQRLRFRSSVFSRQIQPFPRGGHEE